MSLVTNLEKLCIKVNSLQVYEQQYELAPGIVMTIRSEESDILPEIVSKFLRHKAPIPELRKAMKARSSLRYSDMTSASSKTENLMKGGIDKK